MFINIDNYFRQRRINKRDVSKFSKFIYAIQKKKKTNRNESISILSNVKYNKL